MLTNIIMRFGSSINYYYEKNLLCKVYGIVSKYMSYLCCNEVNDTYFQNSIQ